MRYYCNIEMDISEQISDLLQTHECVIVPALGAFLVHSKSAKWESNGAITPPTKHISFNSRLSISDGLLIKSLADRYTLNYNDAAIAVEKYVTSLKQLLTAGENVSVDKIGTLNLNEEGNLQFTSNKQADFFDFTFGLRAVVAKPVEKEKEDKKVVDPQVQTIQPKTISFRRARKIKRLRKAAGYLSIMLFFLAIAGASIIGYKQSQNILSDGVEQAALVPSIDTAEETPLDVNNESITEPSTTAVESSLNEERAASEIAIEPIFSNPLVPQKGYYIIVGAFAKEDNADLLFHQLEQELSQSTAVIKTQRKNLTAVGFFADERYNDALEVLARAKEKDNSVWLLKMN